MGNSESHTELRSYLVRLNENVPFEDREFWNSLLSFPIPPQEELVSLISSEDVRKLKSEKKLTTSSLLKRIVVTLKRVIAEVSQGEAAKPDNTQLTQIRSSLRLLTRIMPFLLEDPRDEFSRILFWTPGGYVPPVQQEFRQQNHSEIKEVQRTADEVEKTGTPAPAASGSDHEDTDSMIVGLELLASLQRLLFLKGYCCTAKGVVLGKDEALPKHKIDTRFIWKGGIGTSPELPYSQTGEILRNREEVLRCLLVCLSGCLYLSLQDYQHSSPIWMRVFTRGELPYTANVFSSLMSSIFSYDPVGMGVPYGGVFSGSDEQRVVHTSLQLLAVLLDFNPSIFYNSRHHSEIINSMTSREHHASDGSAAPGSADVADSARTTSSPADGGAVGGSEAKRDGQSGLRNVYRSMTSSLRRDSEVQFIFDGFVRMMQSNVSSRGSYLPGSQRAIPFNQELLLVLWHILTTNPQFLRRASAKFECNKVLVPILVLLLDASNARATLQASGDAGESGPSRIGLLHICSFLLLVMSSERDFAVRLNDAVIERPSMDIPVFQGCHTDLLVLVIHKVVMESSTSPANDSLIDMLLTVMCNVSAYTKSLCLESCVKLVSLLHRFARQSWLFTAPYHYHDVFFLLDMFNNIIQYQYEGNQKLVYSILRQKDFFLSLQNLQFPHEFVDKRREAATAAKQGPTRGNVFTASSTAASVADPAGADSADSDRTASTPKNRLSRDDIQSSKGDLWLPTEEWFADWKAKLPLQTISRLLQCLLPLVEQECQEKDLIDQTEVLHFLQRTTLVGLLPVPHPIIIRNYQPNAYTSLWFTSYMWGLLFSKFQGSQVHDWRKVRLIVIGGKSESNNNTKDLPAASTSGSSEKLGTKAADGAAAGVAPAEVAAQ